MSPEYVRPYVRAQKNDDNDAAGIAEAATRPRIQFVELKSQDRLDLQDRAPLGGVGDGIGRRALRQRPD